MYQGHYIYIDAREPAEPGWRADLISENMVNDGPGCVFFWYFMFGYVSHLVFISPNKIDLLLYEF